MSTPNTDKRKLKTEPKLRLDLNEEQKGVVENTYAYDVTFSIVTGKQIGRAHV